MTYLTDKDNFCRHCRGSGQIKEITDRDTVLHDRCDHCGGTGLHSTTLTEHAQSSACTAGGACHPEASPKATSRFNRVEAQWIADVLLPSHYDTEWDRMRWIERMQELNVHCPDLRDLRANDYLTAKQDQRVYRHATMYVGTVLFSALIAFAAIAAP